MAQALDTAPTPSPIAPMARSLQGLYETTKPGITRLVTITAVVGFFLAAPSREWTIAPFALALLGCVIGTALSAAGANAINQFMERERDARMDRTMKRPIPSGRVDPRRVLRVGIALGGLGVGTLLAINGVVPALLSLACLVVYILAYTPMKPWTPTSTLVGTIPGALPPLIGWTSASALPGVDALFEPAGLALVAIMTLWQIPHFLALAWMYRDDYVKGGYRVLTVVDPSGRRTVAVMAVTAALLLPATLAPVWLAPQRVGAVYGVVALVTGAGFLWLVARIVRRRDRSSARGVFFGSIIHLPLLLLAMTGETIVRWAW
ncbi:MAG: protoheme IX farnesyltransferase [Phycisphaerae bacterium]|nr:protoheme IX farnesyltransferase [Phycisphaerae bacterium]